MISNFDELGELSFDELTNDIQQTSHQDMIVELNKIQLIPTPNQGTKLNAVFEGMALPVTKIALGQLESTLLPGFSIYGKRLRSRGMYDLYAANANQLLRRINDNNKMLVRMSTKSYKQMAVHAFLSTSYQPYDDNIVFEAIQNAMRDTKNADDFMSLGGYRSNSTTYFKCVTKEPLFSIEVDDQKREFSPGFILSNSEVGQGFCRLDVLMIDNYCTNGCIFSSDGLVHIKVLHKGRDLSGLASGTIVEPDYGTESIAKVKEAIYNALKSAFNKNLYKSYQKQLQGITKFVINEGTFRDVELYVEAIGKILNLTETEIKNVLNRLYHTGDRSLFGIQAALTDAAKYARSHDRRLELELAGGRIFTEITRKWRSIKKSVAAERKKRGF